MNFSSFGEFLAMGGHYAYVWSSYGITLAVMVATVVVPLRRHRRLLAELRGQSPARGGHREGKSDLDGQPEEPGT